MNQTPTGTASVGYARALLEHLRDRGQDPASLFPAELLTRFSGEAASRINLDELGWLLERAIAVTRDPELPLHLAGRIGPRHLGIVGYVTQSCATLGDAVNALVRYERIVDDANQTQVNLVGDKFELHWISRLESRRDIFMKLSLATWVTFGRGASSKPDLTAEAHFSCPRPINIAPYAQVFGHPARFEAPETKLVFPASYARLPITLSDPEMHRQFAAQAEAQLRLMEHEADIVREIRIILSRGLASGRVTLEQAAEALNVAPRTLQYRLDEHGITFRELLDSVRQTLAENHLANTRISVAEVAFLLGYADQSSFQHAFKRWTGRTPGQFRATVGD